MGEDPLVTAVPLGLLGTYDAPPAPRELRLVRGLLLVTALLCGFTVAGYVSLEPLSAERWGEAVWGLLPGVAAALLAFRAGPGRVGVLRGVVALAATMALLGLGRLAVGEVQGLTNLLIPLVLLLLVLRGDVRAYLRGDPGYSTPPAPRPRGVGRSALFRRAPAGQGGQSAVEVVGVLAVAALVVGIGTAALVASNAREGSQEVACTIMEDSGCGSSGGTGAAPGPGGAGSPAGGGGSGGCNGVLSCIGATLGFAVDVVGGALGAFADDVLGLFALVMDPSLIVDAVGYILSDPGGALLALVWDAESQAFWDQGSYGALLGRLVYNVGTILVPVGKITKLASLADAARLARGGADAADLARLVDLAEAGPRAQRAAQAGNLGEAADIAVDARRQADELQRRADAAGCLSVGSTSVRVFAAGPARGATVVVAGGDICGAAGDAARAADESADAALGPVKDASGRLIDVQDGRFAQTSYSERFSADGAFGGRTIDDVAGDLRAGTLSPADVPIDVIVRDGNTLILNTRSAQALERAGVPRSQWNVVNRTGEAASEARLDGQLSRNGLDTEGYVFP